MQSATLLDSLPPFLKQRTRVVSDAADAAGDIVVYWMVTAARADENPALDAARVAANTLGCPLVVYHGLSSRYPFASDRHHRFILEGARDVERALAERDIPYLFHLEREGSPPILKQLAQRAALLVTENLPTPPIRRWVDTLLETTDTPIWCVDTACVVSLESTHKVYTRAFAFRDQLAEARDVALRTPYPTLDLPTPSAPSDLPVPHLSLQDASLERLIASCPIDHTIPAVRDTQGGAGAANMRWERFKERGIRSYHRKRNDAAIPGVSRMSAYLHYGHISPFRVAREASEIGGPGANKFLDELLVWRELAYHWCDRVANPGAWEALPSWARETLMREADVPRRAVYSWEQLARAATHDTLWNLAQRSLLHHGELHNNLRMTWGKQLHAWTTSPQQSLRWLIDLNHRYALDGRDPCSYAGLLWCLGLFDRPFKPAKRIYGTVRTRSSAAHAKRLDVDTYTAHVGRDAPTQTIAVVGAGLAGLMCARTLHDHRYHVTVFDKGRVPGGRVSTRRSRTDPDWVFDHGAPCLEGSDKQVQRWLLSWENAGVLARWEPREQRPNPSTAQPRFVGIPNNSALGEHLAADVQLHAATRVTSIERTPQGWMLATAEATFGPFDVLILNLPSEQLAALNPVGLPLPNLPTYAPTHAVMMRFDQPLPIEWDTARPEHPDLAWIAREASKPGRPDAEQWILHSSPAWSARHLERPPSEVEGLLIEAFQSYTKVPLAPSQSQIHRWRYAQVEHATDERSMWDDETMRGICGDLFGAGVEGALLSGAHLAGQVMSTLQRRDRWGRGDAPLFSTTPRADATSRD